MVSIIIDYSPLEFLKICLMIAIVTLSGGIFNVFTCNTYDNYNTKGEDKRTYGGKDPSLKLGNKILILSRL